MRLPGYIIILSFFLNVSMASALTFSTDGSLLYPNCENNSNDIAIYLVNGETLLDGFGCMNERDASTLGGDFIFYESTGLCTSGLSQAQCSLVDVGYAYAESNTVSWFLPFTIIPGGTNDALIASIGAFVVETGATLWPIVAGAIAIGLTFWVILSVMELFEERRKKRYGKNNN